MPLFDYECEDCGHIFEFLKVRTDDTCTECVVCKSTNIKQIVSVSQIRMDPEVILKSLPDPTPPLEELRGIRPGALEDKPYASTRLRDYIRKKDKYGNTIWIEKSESDSRTKYFT